MIKILPQELIQFILYPKITGWLLALKFIFISFGVFFTAYVIWALIKTTWLKRIFLWDLKEFLTYRPYGTKKFKKEWKKIKDMIATELESELKLALIEADKILNKVLEDMGYAGESLGERLDKLTTDILPNLEEVRQAHQLRNDVVHDPSYRIDIAETKKALAAYERALDDLDAI